LNEENEPLKTYIDWELEKDAFQCLVRDMIKNCVDHGKVITLPITIIHGQSFIEQLGMLLSQVDCKDCNKCCLTGVNNFVDLTPQEARIFSVRYGASILSSHEDSVSIPYPCCFLKDHKCSIYPERPLVCAMYPFQSGGFSGEEMKQYTLAVASDCPEGRRIARAIFMTTWRLRRQFKRAIGNFN